MKKLIYCAAALAAMIFAGSCQRENLEPVAQENTVTYTVELPDAQTKGFMGTVSKVDKLVYEVWKTEKADERDLKGTDANGKAKATLLYHKTVDMVGQRTVITLNLVQDQEYTVLFWAQKEGTGVYNTDDLTDVHYAKTWNGSEDDANCLYSNQESYEAYYATEFISDEDQKSRTVVLKRPFAQLNLGTRNTQMENTNKKYGEGEYNVEVVSSKVTVSNVGTHFNVANNYVATPTTDGNIAVSEPASMIFETAADPSNAVDDETSQFEYITVGGQQYEYVAMNYLFATGANVTVSYEINTKLSDKNGNNTTDAKVTNTVYQVPLQENYRTNIVGNLLTSETEYEVVIDPYFSEPDYVSGQEWTHTGNYTYTIDEGASAAALKEVLAHANAAAKAEATKAEGPVVKIDLAGDVVWETGAGHGSTPLIPEGSPISAVVINGNGKTFTATGAGVGPIRLANGGKLTLNNLTIVDESESYAENSWEFGYLEMAGVLEINDCNVVNAIMFEGETAVFAGCTFNSNKDNEYAVWVSDGIATFNGCTFEGARGLKVHEDYGSEVASVVVDGCTFGPLTKKPGIALGTLNAETAVTVKNSKFVSCQAGDQDLYMYETDTDVSTFTFVNENNKVYGNPSAMIADWVKNAQAGDIVNIPAGEYTFPASEFKAGITLNCAEGTVFTGTSGLNINGATVIGATFKDENKAVSGTIHGTFKDCTFDASEALRWCYSEEGKDVVFEDCVIKTDFRGFHFDGMDGNVIFRRCKINGFNAYGGEGTATFEECVFGNDESTYNGLNTYSNTVLTDCQFNFISCKTNFIDMEGTGKTLTITNCTATLDGVAKPVTDFVGGSKINQNTVILDGKECVMTAAQLTEALADDSKAIITLAPGVTYEGTFHVLKDKQITSADADNKSMIKGRVHVNSANATFTNVSFDRNETNSNEPNNTASNALQYKAIVMIYGDQTHTIKFEGCNFYNSNGTHKSAITNVACDLIVDNCYFEGWSSSIYSQANLSVTNSTFNYTGGNNVILSINGCGDNGGKVIFKNNEITNKIFALSQFLNTVGFGNGTYHFDVQENTGAGFDYYFLNETRVANKTFANGSMTF